MSKQQSVLFLMSDTGGGHRAAAEAIRAAMEDLYPLRYRYQLVDVFKDYTPFPFNQMPDFYPVWVNNSKLSWHLGYQMSNTRNRSKLILDSFQLSWRRGFVRLFEENQTDIVISVHPLFNRPAVKILNDIQQSRPPFMTVVTDLVSTHAFWYESRADVCLVPTFHAYERGLKYGMPAKKMKITGLPIHPAFVNGLVEKQIARQELGWDRNKLTVMMVSGGQGIGPVYETARAINAKNLNVHLVVVTGSNTALKQQLDAQSWNQTTTIYPFRTDMARLMAAADILVTKAGPASICEACVAGLPMIISDYIPGQEDGNVRHIVENHAGIYAPSPERVADALEEWVNEPSSVRNTYAKAAAALGRPEAAWTIGTEIHNLLNASSRPVGKVTESTLFHYSSY
ncbi:MAG: glycosyltransferase [Chloroflexi bacterium]|nr:glycosyltransferase [Chloroflexota bacterium]